MIKQAAVMLKPCFRCWITLVKPCVSVQSESLDDFNLWSITSYCFEEQLFACRDVNHEADGGGSKDAPYTAFFITLEDAQKRSDAEQRSHRLPTRGRRGCFSTAFNE